MAYVTFRLMRSAARVAWGGVLALMLVNQAHAQFVTQQVGGISIDADGVVSNVRLDELNALRQVRRQAFEQVPGDMQAAALRKVSLRRLEAAIAEHHKTGAPIPDEMRYLAGLQRIQYVLVYPETNDIVLAGPGEGWKLNEMGEPVGVTTHRPVMLLDDLLVALRAIEATQQTGITCSIDPTTDGLGRLQSFLKTIRRVDGDPNPIAQAMAEQVGPQKITVGGVPATSHFARVLVAADYRMKRLAMAFEEPPIEGLPSYLQMVKTSRGAPKHMMPRWWLEPDYDALVTDLDGLAWEFPKAGVKALTEDEFLDRDGEQKSTGKVNPTAKKWADIMTARYDDLAAKDAIFGQLRNCMDMAVVAALISREHLTEKCGWSMSLLMNPELPVQSYHAPRQVDSQASLMQKRDSWLFSVSGGILMAPWQIVENRKSTAELSKTREQATASGAAWWWN